MITVQKLQTIGLAAVVSAMLVSVPSGADDKSGADQPITEVKQRAQKETHPAPRAVAETLYDQQGNPIQLASPLRTVARSTSDDGITAVMEDFGLEGWRGDLPGFGTSSLDALADDFSAAELADGADLNISTAERRQQAGQTGFAFNGQNGVRGLNSRNSVLGWNRGLGRRGGFGLNRGFGNGLWYNPREFSIAARNANRTINRAMNRGRFELGGTGYFGSRWAGRW